MNKIYEYKILNLEKVIANYFEDLGEQQFLT